MKQTLGLSIVSVAVLCFAHAVMAQTATSAGSPPKKEAAVANVPPISAKSETPRAEVKKETAEANKAGQIPGTGGSNVPAAAVGTESPKERAATSTTTRAERKKDTAAANKAGQIPGTGVGESADIPKK